MPKTIKIGTMGYKDPTTGQYVGINAVNDADLVEQVQAVEDSIAPDYANLAFPVSIGQKCYHENVLYAANQNIPTSEAWTASHWGAVTISGELDTLLNEINDKYEKPSTGIPKTDLASGVQNSLDAADSAYQKPQSGIPASDLASGVIPSVPVQDVQVNGTSVLNQGVANVPFSNASTPGVVKTATYFGFQVIETGQDKGQLSIFKAPDDIIKSAGSIYRPIVPSNQHNAVFYGLAKAAGDTTQASSSNSVGNYTETAKSAISQMLNGAVAVSGTTPSITAKDGIQYLCGEVATISFTPPASGATDVIFTSGSTPAVLTVPNTVKFPAWFNPSSLAANTTYEINILNGTLGVVMAWT